MLLEELEVSFVEALYAMALGMPRVLTALAVLPFLSPQIVGGTARSLVALSFSLVMVPATLNSLAGQEVSGGVMLLLLPKEMLIGAILGFLTAVPFWVAAGLGGLMDIQRGTMAATLFTPLFQDQTSPLGVLLVQAAAVLFLSGAGVLMFLEALYQSYWLWPVWSFTPGWSEGGEAIFISQFQAILYWIVVLGAPTLILVLLIDVVMGLLNRFVPEINVFFLAFPFKALIVLFVLAVYAGVFTETISREFFNRQDWLLPLFEILS